MCYSILAFSKTAKIRRARKSKVSDRPSTASSNFIKLSATITIEAMPQ